MIRADAYIRCKCRSTSCGVNPCPVNDTELLNCLVFIHNGTVNQLTRVHFLCVNHVGYLSHAKKHTSCLEQLVVLQGMIDICWSTERENYSIFKKHDSIITFSFLFGKCLWMSWVAFKLKGKRDNKLTKKLQIFLNVDKKLTAVMKVLKE